MPLPYAPFARKLDSLLKSENPHSIDLEYYVMYDNFGSRGSYLIIDQSRSLHTDAIICNICTRNLKM
jgi:hypothetical protein